MKIRWHRWTRKAHRYLGVLIGIQFMAWTIGGLYFSWTDLDKVHGDDLLGPPPSIPQDFQAASLDSVIREVSPDMPGNVSRIDLIPISETEAVYRISYLDQVHERQFVLADAETGDLRENLSIDEAREIATFRYSGNGSIEDEQYIESTSNHSEFRGLPLPVFAFSFDDERHTTIYVSAMHPQVVVPRSGTWRIFDFLWMLHTMDYEGRDDFNNILLQGFAVFGLLTLLSGFALFLFSSKLFRHAKH